MNALGLLIISRIDVDKAVDMRYNNRAETHKQIGCL